MVRIDNERGLRPDVCANARALPLRRFPVDVLWASPRCIEFARATFPWLRKLYPNLEPDLSLAKAALDTRDFFRPGCWVLENTLHSRRCLVPILGAPRSTIPGHVFWGDFSSLLPQVNGMPKESLWPHPVRAAELPYEIGEAICIAVDERRRSLAVPHPDAAAASDLSRVGEVLEQS